MEKLKIRKTPEVSNIDTVYTATTEVAPQKCNNLRSMPIGIRGSKS